MKLIFRFLKAIKVFFLLFAITAFNPGYAQTSSVDSLLLPSESYTLKNGLQVILQPDPTVHTVSIEFWLKDGYRMDTEHEYGLMHFYEHVTPYSKMDSISRSRYKKSITDSNAQVRPDFSRYYLEMEPEGLPYALEVAAGRLKAAPTAITTALVERERKRVLSEIARNTSNPLWSAKGGMALHSGVFGADHPYGHNAYGLVENNEKFKVEDFRNRHSQVAFAHNTILFVVGNFDSSKTKQLIKNYYGPLPLKRKMDIPLKSPKYVPGHITMKAPSENDSLNTLVFAWGIPEYVSPQNDGLPLLSTVLQQRLKENKSIPVSIVDLESYVELFQYAGMFICELRFSNGKDPSSVEDYVRGVLDELIKKGVRQEELEMAKEREIEGIKEQQRYLGFQYSRTSLLGESLLFTGDLNFYLTRLKNQQMLTQKSLDKAARKWLAKKPFRILFTANKGSGNE